MAQFSPFFSQEQIKSVQQGFPTQAFSEQRDAALANLTPFQAASFSQNLPAPAAAAAPEAPSFGDTVGELEEFLPRLLDLFGESGTRATREQLELQKQFAPEFFQLELEAQEKSERQRQALFEELNPELAEARRKTAGLVSQRVGGGLTEEERERFRSDFFGALGTNAGSPIGAATLAENLQFAGEQSDLQFGNLGVALSGQVPASVPAAVQNPQVSNPFLGTAVQSSNPFNLFQQNQNSFLGQLGLQNQLDIAGINASSQANALALQAGESKLNRQTSRSGSKTAAAGVIIGGLIAL